MIGTLDFSGLMEPQTLRNAPRTPDTALLSETGQTTPITEKAPTEPHRAKERISGGAVMVEQLENQIEALRMEIERYQSTIQEKQAKIDALEQRATERARQDAEQTRRCSAAETALYKALNEGQNTALLLLQALDALEVYTGNTWIKDKAREIIEAVHGYALREPAAAEMAAEAAEHRLEMLERAYSQTDDSGEQKRIKNAIQAHQRKIAKLRK